VQVRESRPGEWDEPRHFLRRAIFVLNSRKSVNRNRAAAAQKAYALFELAFMRAIEIGTWSPTPEYYDPLPDLVELRDMAAKRLGGVADENDYPIGKFRHMLEWAVASWVALRANPQAGGNA
jgi:hypothetical protein